MISKQQLNLCKAEIPVCMYACMYVSNCSRLTVNTELFEMIVGILTTCHTQYTWDSSMCIFYLIEQHSKFLLHTFQVLYMCTICDSTDSNTIIQSIPNCM
jgi:hypothetical protein